MLATHARHFANFYLFLGGLGGVVLTPACTTVGSKKQASSNDSTTSQSSSTEEANGQSQASSTATPVQKIKSLYLQLASQVSEVAKQDPKNQEAQDVVKLATAIGNAPDNKVQVLLGSGFVESASSGVNGLDAKTSKSLPSVIKDKKTQGAAIALIVLGSLSLAGSLLIPSRAPFSTLTAFSVGIAAIVLGSELSDNPANKKKKKAAQDLAISGAVLAMVFGLGRIVVSSLRLNHPGFDSEVKLKAFAQVRSQLPSDITNNEIYRVIDAQVGKEREGAPASILGGVALVFLGIGLSVTASKLNLTDQPSPSTPYDTLVEINNLIPQISNTKTS